MKWPQLVPLMRSAKQAMYVRELTWNYVRDNPDLTYEQAQFCIDRIDHLTRFIAKRSIDKPLWYEIEDYFWALVRGFGMTKAIPMLSKSYNLSQRQIKFLLRQEIKTNLNYEKRTGTN